MFISVNAFTDITQYQFRLEFLKKKKNINFMLPYKHTHNTVRNVNSLHYVHHTEVNTSRQLLHIMHTLISQPWKYRGPCVYKDHIKKNNFLTE